VKLPYWLKILAIILIIFLVYALIRGCKNAKHKYDNYDNISAQLTKVLQEKEDDSLAALIKEQLQRDTIAFINGQLALFQNKNLVTTDSLRAANNRITTLLHKPISIPTLSDSGRTTVNNEFIADCSDCFKELSNGQQLVTRYKSEKDSIQSLLTYKISIMDDEINDLNKTNNFLHQKVNDAVSLAQRSQKQSQIRRTLYFSLAALSIKGPLPSGVGAGFIYMDKHMRLFGANYFISNYGAIYQAQLSMPLSLKGR
jgi:hypothetical protein